MALEIIYGPERSGKKRHLLKKAAEAVRSNDAEHILILVPTREYWKSISEMILEETASSAIFLPQMFTLETIADRIIQSSGTGLKKIDPVESQFIISEIIRDLSKQKKLNVFEQSTVKEGFTKYISNFIGSMKQAEISAEMIFERLGGEITGLSEAVLIYKSYQAYLLANNLYDNEGLFWKAKETFIEGSHDLFSNIELLLIYGFTSFTYVQRDLLKIILQKIPESIISLCYEEDSDRDHLFDETANIIDDLKSLQPKKTQITVIQNNWLLRPLERNLFTKSQIHDNANQVQLKSIEAIKLFDAPDIQAETEAVAARIKTILIERDISPEDFAVVCPVLGDYESIIKREFNSAGIPFAVNSSIPLDKSPLGLFVAKMLKAIINDVPREEFKLLMGNRFFYRYHIAAAGANRSNNDFARLSFEEFSQIIFDFIERSNIPRGIDNWIGNIQALLESELTEAERVAANSVNSFLIELLKIRDASETSKAGAVLQEFLNKILSENDTFHLEPGYQILEERKAAEALDTILKKKQPSIMKDDNANYAALRKLLFFIERTEILPEIIPEGRVLITNPYAFRGRKIKFLFFMGLNSGNFPRYQKPSRTPFYKEIVRLNSEFEKRLPRELEMAQDQMILFYSVLCSVDQQLTLSWIKNDESDKSIFINDVLHCINGLKIENEFPFHKQPAIEKITNEQKLLQAVRLEISKGNDTPSISKTEKNDISQESVPQKENYIPVEQLFEDLCKYTRLSDIENRRESGEPPDNYDGVLSDIHILQIITKKYNQNYQFSATMFKDFGECPFNFFSKNILKLRILEERKDELNPLDEGVLFHSILYKLYSELRSTYEKKKQKTYEMLPDIYNLLDEIIEKRFEEMTLRNLVSTEYLNIKKDQIKNNLRHFINYDLLSSDEFKPLWFEAGFGGISKDEEIDSISIPEPITIELNDEKIHIAGKIDRMDLVENEEKVLQVLDYKTKNYSGIKALIEGIDFQLSIYLLAAEKIALAHGLTPTQIIAQYLSIKERGRSKKLTRNGDEILYGIKKPLDVLKLVKYYLFAYKKKILSGFFAPFPRNKCERCSQRRLCRYNQTRIELKRMPELINDSK